MPPALKIPARPTGSSTVIAPLVAVEQKYQHQLGFAEGWLTIRTSGFGAQNGDGWLSFKDDDLGYEAEDGPLYRIAELPASELIAIRDFLNRIIPCDPAAPSREVQECLWQYESDLLHPPTGDSLQRRLERVRAVIAKALGK